MNIYLNNNLSFYLKTRTMIRNFSKKHAFFGKIYKFLYYWKWKLTYLLRYYRYDVDEQTVIFESFFAKSFSDSPKAIYLKMKEDMRFKDYKFIWVFANPDKYKDDPLLKDVALVKRNTPAYYEALSKSRVWVNNSRKHAFLTKKPNQIYLQTWHGTPFKKIGFDIEAQGNSNHSFHELRTLYKRDSNSFDYILSPSEYCTEKLISSFDIEDKSKVLELGYPRNDFLKNHTEKDVNTVKVRLGIPAGRKVVFYAPTWRENQHSYGIGFTFNSAIDFEKLCSELGDDVVLLVRYHYFVSHGMAELKNPAVIDVSSYPDINDLYIASDLLITDYSSVFFDYALLNRPIVFYMYDLDEYANDLRGFYFSPDLLPGEIVMDAESLAGVITENLISDDFLEKRQDWVRKFSYLDDGKAAERVVERIFGDIS
ncbi:MAG: hypothetical protein K0R71_773 [Bacillales bacterium]|jgi:CDP-glycerol glycerophosphotransferase|nr:hypothetical protein [Bacillales bacterium]